MKKHTAFCLSVVAGTLLSSCATPSSKEQWKSDQSRYEQQLKHFPDRESANQEKADAEAARREKIPSK